MAPNPSAASGRPPLRILMLHGYTQSGPLFHAKSRALVKHIQKNFPSHEVVASYPTGPLKLRPSDVPGYEPSEGNGTNNEDEIEAYGWFRRSNTSDPPLYQGLEDGLAAIAKVLSEEGPFDGVIGFSQGAAMVGMVAGLLETGRQEAFAHFEQHDSGGASGIPYPASFAAPDFQHPRSSLQSHTTPVLHVLGSLDAVVEESKSRALIEACAGKPEADGLVVWHPGGHFLPSQRPYLDAVARFIREQLEKNDGKKKTEEEEEEDVNDMDVPF
ncbi:hypothetical protein N7539_007739 [Penicillium diatomitis]|uniref:Serine hydrolase domain-containing protein n=1 Tax=Penicillium diatomitis TaxID=2819901 RepID=A0A9X0BNQ0_9EURO|nr:uncharacterized protein N7539_007739 [Penicillium diatomitis]KAJ5475452.1 hypothetical protein N7539_007739 [Penicillium diatomitis]